MTAGVMQPAIYADMKIDVGILLMNGTTQVPMQYDERVKKHLTITFFQQKYDFTSKPPIPFQIVSKGIKACSEEDMDRTE